MCSVGNRPGATHELACSRRDTTEGSVVTYVVRAVLRGASTGVDDNVEMAQVLHLGLQQYYTTSPEGNVNVAERAICEGTGRKTA